jgi:hypothetical protein
MPALGLFFGAVPRELLVLGVWALTANLACWVLCLPCAGMNDPSGLDFDWRSLAQGSQSSV